MTVAQHLGLATALVVIPIAFLISLWTRNETNTFHWLLKAGYSGAFFLMMFVTGPWAWVSYHLRWAWLILYALVITVSYRRQRAVPFRVTGGTRTWSDAVPLALFLATTAYALTGFAVHEPGVYLEFPLRDGAYYVGQGGNNPLINYHNTHPSQKYALDILAIDRWGRRAAGWYPAELDKYVMFGRPVYSPCDGVVTKVVDGHPDLSPPESDPQNAPGNHVVIHCHGVNVVFAHLKQESVTVAIGDRVDAGVLIGAVGNSGNTTEPHLHIHAVRAEAPDAIRGAGVPLYLDGRFLVRNNVVRK